MSESSDPTGPVEALYQDYIGLVDDLTNTSPSGLAALNRSYHKVLLIASASSLEAQVKRTVTEFFEREGRKELSTFVEKRVMARNYHALFDWPSRTAAGFFKSFGDDCAEEFKARRARDEVFRQEHDAFMKLGDMRNNLVHQDYATFFLEHTPEDLIGLYRNAARFPRRFESIIVHRSSEK